MKLDTNAFSDILKSIPNIVLRTTRQGAEGVHQMVEGLPSKFEALGSIPRTPPGEPSPPKSTSVVWLLQFRAYCVVEGEQIPKTSILLIPMLKIQKS